MWGKKLTAVRIHRRGGQMDKTKAAFIAQAGLKMAKR